MRVVPESSLKAVLSGLPGVPRVVMSGSFGTPWTALALIDASIAQYRLFAINAQAGVPDRDGVILETPFVGPGMRGRKRLRYFPCRLSLVPQLLTHALPPDVVLVHASMPLNGTVSLGMEVNILPAAIEAARARGGMVVAQLNARMPYAYGDAVLSEEEVDYAIEVDTPLPSPPERPVSDISQSIADRVGALVPDGGTLQLGIGAVPDAVLAGLRSRRGLAVWSEMFSDGVLDLEKAGALDPVTPITSSFAFGSAELYEWINRNPRVRMLRTEKTNDPGLIAKQRAMVAVNSALQVDLFAQANASRVHAVIYSGFGGQTDFVVGALHSPGGHAVIALPSWHAKAGVSTVVPKLPDPVTSFQHSFIVSEQGTAKIWGNDATAQAEQIVNNVAHPSARDGLRAAGDDLGFRLRLSQLSGPLKQRPRRRPACTRRPGRGDRSRRCPGWYAKVAGPTRRRVLVWIRLPSRRPALAGKGCVRYRCVHVR